MAVNFFAEYTMTIDGKPATSSDVIEAINPATEAVIATVPDATREQLDQAVAAAKRAFPAWSARPLAERQALVTRIGEVLQSHAEDLSRLLTLEQGKAKPGADWEIGGSIAWCGGMAAMSLETRIIEQDDERTVEMRHTPLGVVGAITPWNFPMILSFIDVVPALLAGCAALIKPSEVTPRFSVPVEACIATVPELRDVLGFVRGDGRSGAALIEHVDVVAFTGSVATGKKVAAAAAAAFIPAFLELGGKDPVILLPGSDLERASTAILRASILSTGQACQSLERIYVHESQHDAFLALLSAKARAVPLSYPDISQGIIGPLIFDRQAEIIRQHIEDAVAKGAQIETGGEVRELDGGLWIEPTVISRVDHSMAVMTEETFGPVMPVMKYVDEAEAIALANDTYYGLSGAVFGPNEDNALRVAGQIEAGAISVNDAGMTTMVFDACKSAFRLSGMGPSRMGSTGLTRFLRQKAIYINRGPVVPIQATAEDPQEHRTSG